MSWMKKNKPNSEGEKEQSNQMESLLTLLEERISGMESRMFQKIEAMLKAQEEEKEIPEEPAPTPEPEPAKEEEEVKEQPQEEEKEEPQPQEEQPTPTPITQPTETIDMKPILEKIESLEQTVQTSKSEILEQLLENEKLEDLLRDRNGIIQSYQEDIYKKLTMPLLKQFISLADMMSIVLQDKETEEKDAAYWKKQFEETIKSVYFTLKDFSVNTYKEAQNGDAFDPNRQEVSSTQETTDEQLDKKIYRSVSPGYTWELPYILRPKANGEKHLQTAYEFIIRKEQVETYKYINPNKDENNG